jgi:hypothetical protein
VFVNLFENARAAGPIEAPRIAFEAERRPDGAVDDHVCDNGAESEGQFFLDLSIGIKNLARDFNARIIIDFPKLCNRVVTAQCDRGDAIKKYSVFDRDGPGRPRHHSPDVPRQHLDTVERSEVADEVLRDPPQALLFDDRQAEEVRISAACAALLPGIASEDEAVMRHIGGIEVDPEGPSLHLLELGVDEHPATLGRAPVLGNPVVFETAWVEICTEAAARTGGHPLFAQDRRDEAREVPAHTGHAFHWRTGLA